MLEILHQIDVLQLKDVMFPTTHIQWFNCSTADMYTQLETIKLQFHICSVPLNIIKMARRKNKEKKKLELECL